MMQGFLLGQGASPDDYATRRAMIQAMMPQFGSARTIGEGLGQLFTGIGLGRQQTRLDREEAAAKQGAQDQFNALLSGGGTAQPGGFSILGQAPVTPGQGVANDTMAALGYGGPMGKDAVVSGLVQRGIPQHIAEGFAMNFVDESGLNTTALGDNGNAYGLAQWNGPRKAALEAYAAKTGKPASDMNTQLDFLVSELQGGEAAAWGQISTAKTPQEAAVAVLNAYERPAEQHRQRREAQYSTAQLAAAANNPMLPADMRAAAAQLLSEQMAADQRAQQQQDPAYQMGLQRDALGLQKDQLELAQMQQPKPGYRLISAAQSKALGLPEGTWQQAPDGKFEKMDGGPELTSDMKEYNFAVSQGYKGDFVQYQSDLKKAGATSVNVNNGSEIGTIPQGYEVFTDPNTGARSMRPIAGGPEDPTKKNALAADARAVAGDTITTAADRALAAARAGGSGTGQGFFANMPWTDSAEVSRQVEVLKSQAKVENLTAMRAASPTGGALGSVTDKEAEMLSAKSGALDPSSPSFERDLADYTLTLLKTVHGETAGEAIFAQTWKGEMPAGFSGVNKAPVSIQGDADYNALPSGTVFVGPDGVTRRKP